MQLPSRYALNSFGIVALLLLQWGCVSKGSYSLNVMPSPTVFDEEIYDSLITAEDIEDAPYDGIPYITDRLPLDEDSKNKKERFYGNERSSLLRVGFGKIEYAGKAKDLESKELRRKSKIPIEVTDINELGLLAEPLPYGVLTNHELFNDAPPVDEKFASLINQKLASSNQKDIFLFVHGYKVIFDNPLLVAAEMWHFMGFKGAFIAYTWPSTPRGLAYFKDTETAQSSGQNLRLALEYLAKHTDTEKIHIIGYSAGTRVVITALRQLALINDQNSKESILQKYKLGQVALIGSDYDSLQFGAAIANGITKVPEALTIYISKYDSALGASSFIFGQERLGQLAEHGDIPASARTWLENSDDLFFVDVSSAEKSRTGKGHGYYRKSPWVSSDILMTLTQSKPPSKRGLIKEKGKLTWSFPHDYIEKLKKIAND